MIEAILFWTIGIIYNAVWVIFHPWVMPVYAGVLYSLIFLMVSSVVLYRWGGNNRID